MTNLEQFEFITYYSTQLESVNPFKTFNYTDHDFILIKKFSDDSGAFVECKKCKIKAFVSKKEMNEIYFCAPFSEFRNLKYTCDELIIKSIIE